MRGWMIWPPPWSGGLTKHAFEQGLLRPREEKSQGTLNNKTVLDGPPVYKVTFLRGESQVKEFLSNNGNGKEKVWEKSFIRQESEL